MRKTCLSFFILSFIQKFLSQMDGPNLPPQALRYSSTRIQHRGAGGKRKRVSIAFEWCSPLYRFSGQYGVTWSSPAAINLRETLQLRGSDGLHPHPHGTILGHADLEENGPR